MLKFLGLAVLPLLLVGCTKSSDEAASSELTNEAVTVSGQTYLNDITRDQRVFICDSSYEPKLRTIEAKYKQKVVTEKESLARSRKAGLKTMSLVPSIYMNATTEMMQTLYEKPGCQETQSNGEGKYSFEANKGDSVLYSFEWGKESIAYWILPLNIEKSVTLDLRGSNVSGIASNN